MTSGITCWLLQLLFCYIELTSYCNQRQHWITQYHSTTLFGKWAGAALSNA